MKRAFAAITAVALLSLTGMAHAQDKLTIGFANPLPAYPVWAEADKCFADEAKAMGVNGLTSGPTGLQVDNQFVLDRISQYIATGAKGIIVVPLDGPMYEPLMKDAKSKGIFVVTLNTGDTTSVQDALLGTDYANQGKTVADSLAKRNGDQNVIVLGNQPTGVHRVFTDGFIKAAAAHPNVKLVQEIFDQGDPAQTTDVVSRALTAHPEANVVLSWEGTAVAGITTAIKEKGLVGKVVGVVNDITPEVIAGLKDGTLYGASKQNFCGMAKGAVDAIVALSKGQTVEKKIDTGITFVTLDNLDQESK